ncbi:Lrp/AsnC family transcriptional regulator [Salinarimonas soli]|nr:Lrp/AsnC family transcriptional regulator [Salinarimonas soli]
MDAKDRALIGLLARDARQPVVGLARALGLSRSATQERLRRLEASGVIQGYTVRTRPGSQTLQAWLSITLRPGATCVQLVPAVLACPAVRICHSVAGPVDMMVLAQVGSVEELSALRERFAGLPGVAEVRTAPVLAVHAGA